MTTSGFLVLPDTPAATAAAEKHWPTDSHQADNHKADNREAEKLGPTLLKHPSGRPCLVGDVTPDQVIRADAGSVRVAMVGTSPVTANRLSDLAGHVRSLSDVDKLATRLPGSFHLVVSIDGALRVQGSITGLRRVFHARVDGVDIAAGRSDVLADLTASEIDEHTLAMWALGGVTLEAPCDERSPWSAVSALPPDCCLLWTDERARSVRWWQPAKPERSLADGAVAVREALQEATRSRPDDTTVSTDLSGGMDSTSLCFLAAGETTELLTLRWGEAEAGNDDGLFAQHAIDHLPRATHTVLSPSDLPAIFDDVDVGASSDQPPTLMRTFARMRYTARLVAERGARRHVAGHGGDEVFHIAPNYLPSLLWKKPVTAIRHVRANRALKRWPLGRTIGALLRPGTFSGWWREQAEHLTDPHPREQTPYLTRGRFPLRAPSWMTDHALDLGRETLRHTADNAQPLAEDIGQHHMLQSLRTTAPEYRIITGLFADEGVVLDMPYFDDRVMEAALSVPAHEAAGHWRYKPLLADAMRGIVPDVLCGRATKGELSRDVSDGLSRNRAAIADFFADSLMAQRGLIDPDVVRREIGSPQRAITVVMKLEALIGCETWLRTAERRTGSGKTGRSDVTASPS